MIRGRVDYMAKAVSASGGRTNFILVAAQNPCPCGYYGDTERACTCPPSAVARYSKKVSGPLLDRIDIHVDVPRVNYEKLAADRPSEASATIRARVSAARARQTQRFAGTRRTRRRQWPGADEAVSYTHLTLPTNREV